MTNRRTMMRSGVLFSILFAISIVPARAADVSGHWKVTITAPGHQLTGFAAFEQTGNQVKGWVGPSEDDPIPITGVVKGTKLTINTHPQPGRDVAFAQCEVTVKGDKMTGNINTDKGTIEFVKSATEAKGQ